MSELGKRVAVAAVGIPVVLGLLYLGGWWVTIPVAGFAALGALELYRMASAAGARPFGALGAAGAAGLVAFAGWAGGFGAFAVVALVLLGAVAALAVVGGIVARGPEGAPLGSVGATLFGVAYAGLSLATVPLLHALPVRRGWNSPGDSWAGLAVIALPLAATWIGDAAAYFAGSAWGRNRARLAPTISPNKSWVGFWAALVGAGAAGGLWWMLGAARLPGLELGWWLAIAMGVVLGLGAVMGDLAESLFKREAGVKDSGTFFPGHGGVLDRLDALIVTLPLAYAMFALLGDGA